MRFLFRWQHVAPGTQLAGDAGLVAVINQLQGFETAAVAWEPELLSRRVRDYRPVLLDRLCHDGQVGWLRLTPRPRDDSTTPPGVPSKATPISIVFREDLDWLLEATRGGVDPGEPTVGATAEILEVLRARGACFASELATTTRRLPADIERALWDGVARGLVTSDGFGAIPSPDRGPSPPRLPATVTTDAGRSRRDHRRRSLVVGPADGRRPGPGRAGRSGSPSCSSTGGVSCSVTSPSTIPSASRGGTCNARCVGSKTGDWSAGDGS